MDISYAFKFIFEDKQWLSKLVLLAILTFLAVIPLLGIPALIAALGYMMQIARNVREGMPRPLPEWKKWDEKFTLGGQVFLALLFYNLPLVFIGACSWFLVGGVSSGFIGGGVNLLTLCCALPFALFYMAFAWSMLATGLAEYIELGNPAAIYRFVHLWDVMRANRSTLWGWGLYTTLVNILLSMLVLIPCIGWLLNAVFGFAVHGHLLGQFAHKLSLTNKPLPIGQKRAPQRRRR
jgi:hypothetical protein